MLPCYYLRKTIPQNGSLIKTPRNCLCPDKLNWTFCGDFNLRAQERQPHQSVSHQTIRYDELSQYSLNTQDCSCIEIIVRNIMVSLPRNLEWSKSSYLEISKLSLYDQKPARSCREVSWRALQMAVRLRTSRCPGTPGKCEEQCKQILAQL